MKKIILIMTIIVTASLSCGGEQIKQTDQQKQKADYIRAEEITEANVKHAIENEYTGTHNLIVNFSAVHYKYKTGNEFLLPIFGGTEGTVYYNDLRLYCVKKGYIPENHGISSYVIECKKGEVKKKLHEILDFYQEAFSKYETDTVMFEKQDKKCKIDFRFPSEFFLEGEFASFCYYLCYKNGKVKCFTINVDLAKNSPETFNPYGIIPDEVGRKRIYISIL